MVKVTLSHPKEVDQVFYDTGNDVDGAVAELGYTDAMLKDIGVSVTLLTTDAFLAALPKFFQVENMGQIVD